MDVRPGAGSGKRRRRQGGFTLVELMVTLAVVGILAAVAAPAMLSLINGNRLTGTASELTASRERGRAGGHPPGWGGAQEGAPPALAGGGGGGAAGRRAGGGVGAPGPHPRPPPPPPTTGAGGS